MQSWFARLFSFFVLLVVANLLAPPASAHPHVYIDMKTAFHFDDQGRLESLRITWIFDEFYSAFAVDGATRTGSTYDEKFLSALAEENLKNLAEWNYFTEVTSRGVAIETGKATDGISTWDDETGRLSLTFSLPLKEAHTATPEAPVNVRIFDPSYYISIDYLPDAPVSLAGGSPEGCAAAINVPEVEQVWTNLPESAFTDPNSSLGANFASTVTLTCKSGKS